MTVMTACWYLLKRPYRIWKEICNLSRFHPYSALPHALLISLVLLSSHGEAKGLCSLLLTGATQWIVAKSVLFNNKTNISVLTWDGAALLLVMMGASLWASADIVAVEEFMMREWRRAGRTGEVCCKLRSKMIVLWSDRWNSCVTVSETDKPEKRANIGCGP